MLLGRSLRLLVLTIAYGVVVVAQTAPPTKPIESRYSIVISVDPNVVKSGSQITAKAVLTNKTKDRIALDVDDQWAGGLEFGIEVRDFQGNLAPLTDYGRIVIKGEGDAPLVGRVFFVSLQPGETFKRDVVISKLYDLIRPGKYTVQAQRIDNGAIAKSNTVTISVTP